MFVAGTGFDVRPSLLHGEFRGRLDIQIQGGMNDQASGVKLVSEPVVQRLPHPFLEVGSQPLPGFGLGLREGPGFPLLSLLFGQEPLLAP